MPINLAKIQEILTKYHSSFSVKTHNQENLDIDILMNLYNITPELKQENKQYWGRELGMIWELVTKEYFKLHKDFREPRSDEFGTDKPVDYFVGNMAIDTKYRIGSGDSGTLKKFKQYGKMLTDMGYIPVFLILRSDNLTAAMTAAKAGGWQIYTANDSFDFIHHHIGVNFPQELLQFRDTYFIDK